MARPPTLIGVILSGIDERTEAALKYLVLLQNCLQASFEFAFLPVPPDNKLLERLGSSKPLDRSEIERDMKSFRPSYDKWLSQDAAGYENLPPQLDGLVVVSTARFEDNYYLTGDGDWTILALGNWQRHMAPPSIVEFILTLLVETAVYAACDEKWPKGHHSTKGCLFDFTALLDGLRYKVLTGFLCDSCASTMSSAHSQQLVQDVRLLLNKEWLGSVVQPSNAAITARKLGYDLFHTKGVTPTFWERVMATLEEEAVKNLITIVATVIIAILLMWLGLKGD